MEYSEQEKQHNKIVDRMFRIIKRQGKSQTFTLKDLERAENLAIAELARENRAKQRKPATYRNELAHEDRRAYPKGFKLLNSSGPCSTRSYLPSNTWTVSQT